MADFVQLWVYLSSTPLFGLTATLATYVARAGRSTTAWPRAVGEPGAVVGGGASAASCLRLAPLYPTYFAGAQFVHVLLGPAVVALAWPLWLRRAEVRRRGVALTLAALAGGAAAAGSAGALGWACSACRPTCLPLARAEVGHRAGGDGHRRRLGGVPALAAVFAVLTGMVGALSAKYLFDCCASDSWAVRGFALGTASHGIGAARALQVHPDAGAYAGIALGLQVLLASVLMPLVFRWLQ